MTEKLAIMKGVKFGNGDRNTPCLFFNTYVADGLAALQVLSQEESLATIKDSGVYDVKDLEGKPCWVEAGGGLIKFLRIAKI